MEGKLHFLITFIAYNTIAIFVTYGLKSACQKRLVNYFINIQRTLHIWAGLRTNCLKWSETL